VRNSDNNDNHDKASNAWLKVGGLFPETTGFMIAFQQQIISTSYYKKYILKDPSIAHDICRKCREQLETIQHKPAHVVHCFRAIASIITIK
jgi:hypothetical protein